MSCYIYKPKGILVDFIKCIWMLEDQGGCDDTNRIPLIPSGCIELIFHFGGKGKYSINNSENYLLTTASICGQKLNYFNYFSNGTMGVLAVVLQPSSAYKILRMPTNLFSNQVFELENVFGTSLNEILEKLNESETPNAKFKIIEKYFKNMIKRIETFQDLRMNEFVKKVSLYGGCVSIRKIAEHLNISKRQLERNTLESIGLTPKEFSRIIRFQKSLYIKQLNPQRKLTDLAYECGYSDQSHFINEFKSISGHSPKKYFELAPAFSDFYSLLLIVAYIQFINKPTF